jgi:hypothetical protein
MVSTALQVLLQAALESDNRCGQTVETCGTLKIFKDCLGCCRSLHVLKIFSTFLCFLKTRLEESACMLSLLFKWAYSLTDLSQQKWQVQLPFHGWLHVLGLGLDANHLALCHLAPGPRFALMLAVCWKKWYIMVYHHETMRAQRSQMSTRTSSMWFVDLDAQLISSKSQNVSKCRLPRCHTQTPSAISALGIGGESVCPSKSVDHLVDLVGHHIHQGLRLWSKHLSFVSSCGSGFPSWLDLVLVGLLGWLSCDSLPLMWRTQIESNIFGMFRRRFSTVGGSMVPHDSISLD